MFENLFNKLILFIYICNGQFVGSGARRALESPNVKLRTCIACGAWNRFRLPECLNSGRGAHSFPRPRVHSALSHLVSQVHQVQHGRG